MYTALQELALELADDSVHVVPGTPLTVNVPPAPPSLHDNVPVGTVLVPLLLSVTFPAKVIVLLITTDDGFGDTAVLVFRNVTVSADVPELVVWVLSPG